jgi:sugar lactone lactonase YvrE
MNSKNSLRLLALTMLPLNLAERHCDAQAIYEPYTFTTIAEKAGASGSLDGTGSSARFQFPNSLVLDGAGNVAYVLDTYNDTVRQMTQSGEDWVVTTIAGVAGSAGSADGTNTAARFNLPTNMTLDSFGNIYFGDGKNRTIRKLSPVGLNWVSSTIAGLAGYSGSADGTNSSARFDNISGIAIDPAGLIYASDYSMHTIRQVTPVGSDWVVTTIAGLAGHAGSSDGAGSVARFNQPSSLALGSAGNLFITEAGNKTVREMRWAGTNWVVATLAGLPGHSGHADGAGSGVRFTDPEDIVVDIAGNLYVSDFSPANTIRKLRREGTNWVSSTIGGLAGHQGSTDGTGDSALFWDPAVAVDAAGNLYVADVGNHIIRRGVPALAMISSGPHFGFAGGQFGFDLTGPAGQEAVLEGSSDLVNWTPVWTNTLTGPLSFSDPQSASNPQRFYRAKAK